MFDREGGLKTPPGPNRIKGLFTWEFSAWLPVVEMFCHYMKNLSPGLGRSS